MKYCIDCKWLKAGNYTPMCHSPKIDCDLVTGKPVAWDAKINRTLLETIGCGREAKWFEPKFEMDDDEHIASVFCRGGA